MCSEKYACVEIETDLSQTGISCTMVRIRIRTESGYLVSTPTRALLSRQGQALVDGTTQGRALKIGLCDEEE